MHVDQEPYRLLYDDLMSYEGTDVYPDLVRPWLRNYEAEREWLTALARRRGDPVPAITIEESWRLYALSRIIDVLLPDHAEFAESLGLRRIDRHPFHPFFHEIVSVSEPREYWPGYMLGELMIIRAGRAVDDGSIDANIAEHSRMYWTYRRANRPTRDLSHGWGSNSQWRTKFRRDYAIDGRLHYNVEGTKPARDADDVELLRYRCYVRCSKPDGDLWPYDLTYTERV